MIRRVRYLMVGLAVLGGHTILEAQAPALVRAPINRAAVFTGDVIEISAAGLRGLLNGLDIEFRLLTEFAALLDTYKSPEDYRKCEGEMAMSPEGMAILGRLTSLPENTTAEDMQRATTKMNDDFVALRRGKCGPNVLEDWPATKRVAKLEEIADKAAAASGPIQSAEPRQQGGPAAGDDGLDWVEQQQPKGMTRLQKKVYEERVEAYCAFKDLMKERGRTMPVTPGDGYGFAFGAKLLDPKVKKDVSWVYSAQEIIDMDPMCVKVVLKIGEIKMIMEMAPINIRGRRK